MKQQYLVNYLLATVLLAGFSQSARANEASQTTDCSEPIHCLAATNPDIQNTSLTEEETPVEATTVIEEQEQSEIIPSSNFINHVTPSTEELSTQSLFLSPEHSANLANIESLSEPQDLSPELTEELFISTDNHLGSNEVAAADIASNNANGVPDVCLNLPGIFIRGCTVLPDEIQATAEKYVGKVLTPEEITSLRDEITLLYIQAGYITSKAEYADVNGEGIPQLNSDGTLQLNIIEGYLYCIEVAVNFSWPYSERVEGTQTTECKTETEAGASAVDSIDRKFYREFVKDRVRSFISRQIWPEINTPLNINDLEEQLRLLKNDTVARSFPYFEEVETVLSRAGGLPDGASKLTVTVTEAPAFQLDVVANNYAPPSLGSERVDFQFNMLRPLGFLQDENIFHGPQGRRRLKSWAPITYGEELNISGSVDLPNLGRLFELTPWRPGEIFDSVNVNARYQYPVNATRGVIQFRGQFSRDIITDDTFESLNLNAESRSVQVRYRQPVFRSLENELGLSLGFNFYNGQTFIFNDVPFPFGIGPDDEGVSRTSVFEFGQDYVRRGRNGSVLFLQSSFQLGTGLFNATLNEGNIPDGTFLSWLGQAQRWQRFNERYTLLLKAKVQLTPDSLLPSEQFTIGGRNTVRGYRESALTGDNGFAASIENRIALILSENSNLEDGQNIERRPILEVIPFIDLGAIWNNPDNPNDLPDETFLASIGLGMQWRLSDEFVFNLDYGIPLIDFENKGNNLQDDGVHLGFAYQLKF